MSSGRKQSEMSMMADATGYRIRSFGETLRTRINVSMAVDKLNAAIMGKPITSRQLEAIRIALAKVLPDLKAVAVEFNDNTVTSKADIDSMLLAAGLKPDNSWDTIEGSVVLPTIKENQDNCIPTDVLFTDSPAKQTEALPTIADKSTIEAQKKG